jgi:hypothetical protein
MGGSQFCVSILTEAKKRAERAKADLEKSGSDKFLPLSVGDSRDDDPPGSIRHQNGFNYYYQGKVDNCVMGGLINAVFWLLGLLNHSSPSADRFWYNFVKKVSGSLHGEYRLKTNTSAMTFLRWTTPVQW